MAAAITAVPIGAGGGVPLRRRPLRRPLAASARVRVQGLGPAPRPDRPGAPALEAGSSGAAVRPAAAGRAGPRVDLAAAAASEEAASTGVAGVFAAVEAPPGAAARAEDSAVNHFSTIF